MTQTQRVILGPPGTGKTTFLLNQVQEQMAEGIHPGRIAFVSFTRKAANEAVSRALARFNVPREDFPYFRTLHSLAYQQLGLSRQQVMGKKEYAAVGNALGLVFSDYLDYSEGIPVTDKTGDQVIHIVGMARATMRPLEEQYKHYLSGEVGWFQVKQFADTLAKYKRDTGMLDFSDMLDNFVDNCQPLNIDVAFIDEAQDLSLQQWRMVRHAVSRAKLVFIAGDDDQAIYRWSGADVDSFLALTGEKQVLGQSYRVPSTIHGLCQRIGARIGRRFKKTWRPRDEKGSLSYLSSIADLEWQSGSYLFLARNRFLLDQLEQHVRTEGIPYTIGNRSSLDPEAVEGIRNWEYLRKGRSITVDEARSAYKYLRSGSGVARGHKRLPGLPGDSLISMPELKVKHGLQRDDPWYDALDMIPAEQREFYQVALRRGEKISRTPRVHLSTIHGVKGGEADHVVVVSDMAARTYESAKQYPDDEHRCAYVAASRAKQSLSILLPATLRAYDYR